MVAWSRKCRNPYVQASGRSCSRAHQREEARARSGSRRLDARPVEGGVARRVARQRASGSRRRPRRRRPRPRLPARSTAASTASLPARACTRRSAPARQPPRAAAPRRPRTEAPARPAIGRSATPENLVARPPPRARPSTAHPRGRDALGHPLEGDHAQEEEERDRRGRWSRSGRAPACRGSGRRGTARGRPRAVPRGAASRRTRPPPRAQPTQTIMERRPQKSRRSASFQRNRNRLPNSQGRLTRQAWSSGRIWTSMNSSGSAATLRSSGGWSGFIRWSPSVQLTQPGRQVDRLVERARAPSHAGQAQRDVDGQARPPRRSRGDAGRSSRLRRAVERRQPGGARSQHRGHPGRPHGARGCPGRARRGTVAAPTGRRAPGTR